jgi:hypothetical protein
MMRGGLAPPGGDWYEEFDAIQFERAVRLLLVDQHLRMVEMERRVDQRFVLKVVADGAGRLIFDAVGYALLAGRFGSLGCLEPGRRVTNFRNVAIDGVAEPAWRDARHMAHAVARVCATAAHMNAHITTSAPAIHALNRVIVIVLSESVLVFGMERILARRRRRRHVF